MDLRHLENILGLLWLQFIENLTQIRSVAATPGMARCTDQVSSTVTSSLHVNRVMLTPESMNLVCPVLFRNS